MDKAICVVVCLLVVGIFGCSKAQEPQQMVASAPISKCELRFSAWCITEGAYEISRVLASDGVHDRIWVLRGRFRPDSKLVIFEPNGCNTGYSDQVALLGVDKSLRWQDHEWDRINVRLKHDATCDLQILVPIATNDQMEWGYSEGLPLVRACTKQECPAQSLGDLKSQIRPSNN